MSEYLKSTKRVLLVGLSAWQGAMSKKRLNLYVLQPTPRRWRKTYSLRSLFVLQLLLAILLWLKPWVVFLDAASRAGALLTTPSRLLKLLTFIYFAVLFVGVVAFTKRMRRQGAAYLTFCLLVLLAIMWTLIGLATDTPVLPDDDVLRAAMQKEGWYLRALGFRYFIPGMWSLVLAAWIGLQLREGGI